MKFKAGGSEFPVNEFTLRESFDMDWSVLRLVGPVAVNGIITCDLNGQTFDMATTKLKYTDGLYEMIAIPKLVMEKNQAIMPWYKPGVPKTLKQVCAFYGIPVAYRSDTPEQMWEFPEMKIGEFLQRMSWCVNTGTAPVVTVTAVGTLLVIDLAETMGVGTESANAGELFSMGWQPGKDIEIPQNCNLHINPVTAEPYDDIIKGDPQHGMIDRYAFVTNEALIYQPGLKIRNMQGVARYTSACMRFVSRAEKSPILGTKYEYKGVQGVITEVEVSQKQTTFVVSTNAY